MNSKLYTKFVFNRLLKYCPEWPLNHNLTQSLVKDFSDYYSVIARNVEKVHCNVRYGGVIIKKPVFIKAINILNTELNRGKRKYAEVP